jgi:hypothetical protein
VSKCQTRDQLSTDEQAKLCRRRESNASTAGRKNLGVENVEIKDIFNELLKSVAEFKYLGTLTTTDGWSSKEINRRLGIASSTEVSLNKIWASPVLGLKLKCQLYKALAMTIILYNGECWTPKEQDIKRLEAFHFRCLRKISRMHRNPGMLNLEIDRASKHKVFKITKVPTIKEMLTEKRLRWFGHLMREDEGDPAKETLRKEIEKGSRWFQTLKNTDTTLPSLTTWWTPLITRSTE